MAKQTFNYEQHNICGGPARRVVTQGPKPESHQTQAKNSPAQAIVYADYVRSLSTRFPMPETELVAKTTPRGEGKCLGRNVGDELKAILRGRPPVVATSQKEESIDEWLRRHKIGVYA